MRTSVRGGGRTRNSNLTLDYQPNLIEQIAYRDTWGGGLDTYLKWMHDTLTLLRELLAESGSIYVHCDDTASHYIKCVTDDILGSDNFMNEVIWYYRRWNIAGKMFARNHDSLLIYGKSKDRHTFNQLFIPKSDKSSAQGRAWKSVIGTDGVRRSIMTNEPTKGVPMPDTWEISMINPVAKERLGYPTQKPEALLERIIKASSNEGDLVLDCFVGSGTTAAVAEKLGRRWIAADMGRFAISTTRKRLLDIPGVKPFYVQNMGRYERQAWQSADLEQPYREFILQLYRAEPVAGYQWLHGSRGGRMVHVGAVDAPVALDDVQKVVDEFVSVAGSGANAPTTRGVDILGWDFGLEVDTEAREIARSAGIDVRLLRIPREVMDKKAVDAGDIRFFELAALSVAPKVNRRKRGVELALEDFTIPLSDIPENARGKITHWSQWIDYWAVDWDYRDDTFNNQWQSYRTGRDGQLDLIARHDYERQDTHTIVVKVIDILGNDTTRRLEVKA